MTNSITKLKFDLNIFMFKIIYYSLICKNKSKFYLIIYILNLNYNL